MQVALGEDDTLAMSDYEPDPSPDEEAYRGARRRTTVALASAAALVAILLLALGMTANSPAGCSACHESQSVALADSAHEKIACTVCHAAPPGQVAAGVDVVVRMVPRSIGGVEIDGPGRPIGSGPCLECHGDVLSGEILLKNGLRINHLACESQTHCSMCHSQASHGTSTRVVRAQAMSECVACHLEQGTDVGCETCHDGKLTGDRVRDPVWARIHGPDWEKAHGLGDLRTCTMCHASGDCADCHGGGVPHGTDFGATHGTYAMDTGEDKCLTCHKTSSFCEGCHQIEMPHPAGFLQKHSSVAVSTEDPSCTPCHPLEDCRSCHAFHIHPGGTQPPVGRYGEG